MTFLYACPSWALPARKPLWSELPSQVRESVEQALGTPVEDVLPTQGGYSNKPSYLAHCADGRRVFIKSLPPDNTPRSRALFELEVRGYRELVRLAPFQPRYIADVQNEGWSVLILEAIKKPVPSMPWTPEKVKALFTAFRGVYAAYPTREETPSWIINARDSEWGGIGNLYRAVTVWSALSRALAGENERFPLQAFLSGFADPIQAKAWLAQALPDLMRYEKQTGDLTSFSNLIHLDLRQDNLLFEQEGEKPKALILDWGHLFWGPVVIDIVRLIKNIYSEGGPLPEEMLALFCEITGIVFPQEEVRVALAAITGQMVLSLADPYDDQEARCNWVQRLQSIAGLKWWAREMRLPPPPELAVMVRPTVDAGKRE